ncbi:MAG: polysaccharide deacetylase family protein [Proteobacteria bacterium]|nr:polysaccharide deacetylase family protein [Desulfobacula sp.]MBU3951874.1 polysaccharide deacetylase family protein [Pseudomonadota bacterium]MBU4130417.1 polysaccharide deacetylase family protein [Pseudomonadota bacterium]
MGIVSFTFDDFPYSAAVGAADILDAHGIKGTFYLSPGLINRIIPGIEDKPSTHAEIMKVTNKGHEIGFHSRKHLRLNELGYFDVAKQMFQGSQIKKYTGRKAVSFSYPFGCTYPKRFDMIARLLGYKTTRGIDFGVNKVSDRYDLNAVAIYEHKISLKIIEALLKSLKPDEWMILYTHDVRDNFSKYGCSEFFFKQIVEMVVESQMEILALEDVVHPKKDL